MPRNFVLTPRVCAVLGAAVAASCTHAVYGQIRAFGDAEGYGAIATGGRGNASAPTIYHVTSLADPAPISAGVYTPGTLRDALNGSNRIVVFDVAGEIKLTSAGGQGISSKGDITILGQTAPGEGITITGYQALGFTSRTNVIARYLRLRPGSSSPGSDNGMSMTKTGTAILDHMSIEFGKYNNIDAVADTADRPLITIQHSIIADPISNDTDVRGQGFGAHLEAVNGYYTMSNNLWANSHSRNPMAKVHDQFKNNIEYNTEIGYLTSGTTSKFNHDLVNNAFISGPASGASSDYGQLSTPDTFYAVGNVLDDVKDGVFSPTISNPNTVNPPAAAPLHASTSMLPTLSVTEAYAYVLTHAGATLTHNGLGQLVVEHDDLDQLVVGQVKTLGKGTAGYTAGTTGPAITPVPADVEAPPNSHKGLYHKSSDTGLPNNGLGITATDTSRILAGGVIAGDADKDGVPDAWEASHGMKSNTAADALSLNPLGYYMIEQYANELGDQNDTNTITSGNWVTAAGWTKTVGGVTTHAMANAYDNVKIRGTGAASGNVTFSTNPINPATNQPEPATAMKLSIGGNGPAAGEVFGVSGGTLNVYDTITVGDQNNAALNITGGTVNVWNLQLGNTVYDGGGVATNYTGAVTLSGGTLGLNQIALGVGTPGAWTGGGQLNFTGGTLKALAWVNPTDKTLNGTFSIDVPIAVGGTTATLNTNGFDGAITGGLSGTGTLTKTGNGALTLGGNNAAYSGLIKFNAGTLTFATANGAASSTGTVTLANGTQVNVVTSNTVTPIALANGATATINGSGNTFGGAIGGAAGTTLVVNTASSGGSNFSLGGLMTTFAGTLDLASSTGNVRINQGGSALANFDLGDSTGLIRVANAGNVNLGSLAGTALTKLQGSTNDSGLVTFIVGANGNSTTFAGTIGNGANATPGQVGLTKVGIGSLTLSNAASTYTGVTSVTGGVLNVATLANGGTASGIGSSSSLASNLVLDGGTFRYTGATASTNRALTLGAAGGAIDASGAGSLAFSSAGASVAFTGTAGTHTFTLTGTNAGRNTFALSITDDTRTANGRTSLLKTGLGAFVMSGVVSSYSGGTTISAGTLVAAANDSLGTGNVTVAGGAKLDLATATVVDAIDDAATLALGGTGTGAAKVDFQLHAFTERVGWLNVNGSFVAPGVYTASNLPDYITGSGALLVAVPEPGLTSLLVLPTLALLRRRRNA